MDFPGVSVVKNPPANAGDTVKMWVQSLGPEDPLEKEMQPTAVFLPGESQGQRSRAGRSPRGCRQQN